MLIYRHESSITYLYICFVNTAIFYLYKRMHIFILIVLTYAYSHSTIKMSIWWPFSVSTYKPDTIYSGLLSCSVAFLLFYCAGATCTATVFFFVFCFEKPLNYVANAFCHHSYILQRVEEVNVKKDHWRSVRIKMLASRTIDKDSVPYCEHHELMVVRLRQYCLKTI